MYQERLLAEYRAPKNRRDMPGATARAERKNPICGDAIGVMVHVTNDVLRDVSFTGHGCSLAVASASLLTQAVVQRGCPDALRLIDGVEAMIGGAAGDAVTLPGVLTPLMGVAPFPGRHGCVLMPWLALREALSRSTSR